MECCLSLGNQMSGIGLPKIGCCISKFPHLKLDLTGHHGIIPFMDMLNINNSQVSYLQQSFLLFSMILMCNHGI
jgi:hypothetical protein